MERHDTSIFYLRKKTTDDHGDDDDDGVVPRMVVFDLAIDGRFTCCETPNDVSNAASLSNRSTEPGGSQKDVKFSDIATHCKLIDRRVQVLNLFL